MMALELSVILRVIRRCYLCKKKISMSKWAGGNVCYGYDDNGGCRMLLCFQSNQFGFDHRVQTLMPSPSIKFRIELI